MTQEAKLKKIIEKAFEGGYQKDISISNNVKVEMILSDRETSINDILFDKELAKAIWGEVDTRYVFTANEKGQSNTSEGNLLMNYQWHLQQAVISDNPIDYYYENL